MHRLIANRDAKFTNFLEVGAGRGGAGRAADGQHQAPGCAAARAHMSARRRRRRRLPTLLGALSLLQQYKTYKVVYRRYAGLYFIFCVDASDNELLYLETIHLFVEVSRLPVGAGAGGGWCLGGAQCALGGLQSAAWLALRCKNGMHAFGGWPTQQQGSSRGPAPPSQPADCACPLHNHLAPLTDPGPLLWQRVRAGPGVWLPQGAPHCSSLWWAAVQPGGRQLQPGGRQQQPVAGGSAAAAAACRGQCSSSSSLVGTSGRLWWAAVPAAGCGGRQRRGRRTRRGMAARCRRGTSAHLSSGHAHSPPTRPPAQLRSTASWTSSSLGERSRRPAKRWGGGAQARQHRAQLAAATCRRSCCVSQPGSSGGGGGA